MKLTIVPVDSLVIVDGYPVMGLDLTAVPENIHAVQWTGSGGHIEYNDGTINTEIDNITPYQAIVDAHAAAKDAIENPVYTREEVLATRLNQVDSKTNQLIESGWVYPDTIGQPVRLNATDQANYEGEKNLYAELDYDGTDVSVYFPLQIKVWTGENGEPIMLTIADLAAYKDFVRAGKAWIRSKLNEGWTLKKQLISLTLEELQAWVDPR